MAKAIVSREARKDLIAIRMYIRDELLNPAATDRILHELRRAVEGLQSFPRQGKSLDAMITVHMEYRYLPCENICIFYLENDEGVVIVRILHQKQDHLHALFLQK